MNARLIPPVLVTGLLLTLQTGFLAAAEDDGRAPLVESYLEEAKLAEAETALQKAIEKNPNDQQARFSLGVVQFLGAVEHLGQSLHRYGAMQSKNPSFLIGQFPFLRMPIPKNEDPKEISYEAAGKIIETFLAKVTVAEATLAKVDTSDVSLPLHFGRIRLDFNSDGIGEENEALWKILARVTRGVDQAAGEQFLIVFDGGDVHWLRGYCHLLSGFCEVILAHDGRQLFERTGHLLYPHVKSPYKYLKEDETPDSPWNENWIMDLISFIHLTNFPVVAPERMPKALAHFEAMIEQSRQSWKRIQVETDDDHEWLPNPRQTGVLPNVRVRQEMIDTWHELLDEMQALLQGKKLAPFWRGSKDNHTRGLNVRRIFTEPRQFDLVIFVSGTGAHPYLEEGELTDQRVWRRLTRVFGGEFFGFAVWFN